jgi:membrane protein YqaA with SNARE-associated domain
VILVGPFLPPVGLLIDAAAGAFDTRLITFLVFAAMGRLARNSIILLAIGLGMIAVGQ